MSGLVGRSVGSGSRAFGPRQDERCLTTVRRSSTSCAQTQDARCRANANLPVGAIDVEAVRERRCPKSSTLR
jgi:hypothetical protein